MHCHADVYPDKHPYIHRDADFYADFHAHGQPHGHADIHRDSDIHGDADSFCDAHGYKYACQVPVYGGSGHI